MSTTLRNPLLAYIPSPSSSGFSIGPLYFHAYGICYVFAVAAAIMITRRRWAKRGGDPDLVYGVAWWAFPAGLIGGRIYFDITTPSQMPDHWWGPFAIWDGGLGIWGGIAAGAAVGVWYLRRHLAWPDVYRFINAVTPALLVAQSIGRHRQLLQPGAVRQALDAPVGVEDLAGAPPSGLRAVRDVSAHVSL